jgi:hypothetical protein
MQPLTAGAGHVRQLDGAPQHMRDGERGAEERDLVLHQHHVRPRR